MTDLRAAIDERVSSLRRDGFPNYLGPQRFGRDGQNVERALAWFRHPRQRISRTRRGLWLSSARSALYNKVLAHRVRDGSWNRLLEGEPAMLDGTKGFFVPESAASARSRLADGDIHTSGPWWGRGAALSQRECLELETTVLAGSESLKQGLERAGLDQARRALRAYAQGLAVDVVAADTVTLRFMLPPGVFATTLLAEIGRCRLPAGDA